MWWVARGSGKERVRARARKEGTYRHVVTSHTTTQLTRLNTGWTGIQIGRCFETFPSTLRVLNELLYTAVKLLLVVSGVQFSVGYSRNDSRCVTFAQRKAHSLAILLIILHLVSMNQGEESTQIVGCPRISRPTPSILHVVGFLHDM